MNTSILQSPDIAQETAPEVTTGEVKHEPSHASEASFLKREDAEPTADALGTSQVSILALVKGMDIPDDIESMRSEFGKAIDIIRVEIASFADLRYHRVFDLAREVLPVVFYRPKAWVEYVKEKGCKRRSVDAQVLELCTNGVDGGIFTTLSNTRFQVWANLASYFHKEWIAKDRLDAKAAVEHVKKVGLDEIVKEFNANSDAIRTRQDGTTSEGRRPGRRAGAAAQAEQSATTTNEATPEPRQPEHPLDHAFDLDADPLALKRQLVVDACAKWVMTATEDQLNELMILFNGEPDEEAETVEPAAAVEGETNGTVDA